MVVFRLHILYPGLVELVIICTMWYLWTRQTNSACFEF